LEYLYQQITYNKITDLQNIEELTEEQSLFITAQINDAIDHGQDFRNIDLKIVILLK
jgi:hypothetical protein